MENPEQEIRQVVRSLCQGTPDEQRRTIDRYFTPDAEFVHPFCIAPRFTEGDLRVPGLRRLSSRDALRGIFQWYRMLSPKIVIDIDTALHDKERDKMYLDMRQVFSIWFAPGYHARVRLVTVLDLVPCDLGAHRNGEPQVIGEKEKADGGETGSTATFADVVAGGRRGQQQNKVWRISRQEDLYQVNEFLKFTGPYWFCFWRPFWFVFQLFATAISVFLSLFVALSPWAFQQDPAPGGVEARVEQVEMYHDDDDKDEVKKPDKKADGKNAAASPSSSSHNGGHHSTSGEESSGGGTKGGSNTNGNGQQGRNSKTQSTPPRKSWKGGKKDGR